MHPILITRFRTTVFLSKGWVAQKPFLLIGNGAILVKDGSKELVASVWIDAPPGLCDLELLCAPRAKVLLYYTVMMMMMMMMMMISSSSSSSDIVIVQFHV